MALISNSWMRNKIHKTFLPQPGDGPNKKEREQGYFNIHFLALNEEQKLWTRVSDTFDPGYACTAKMLAETCVCLTKDLKILPEKYGVLTPLSALGPMLIERLIQVNMKFEIDS